MSAAAADNPEPNDVRPVIDTGSSSNWGLWAFLGVLLLGGILLFNALTAARQEASAPSVLVPDGPATGRIASPPPLRTPDRFAERTLPERRAEPERTEQLQQPILRTAAPIIVSPQPRPSPPPERPTDEPVAPQRDSGPQVVFEASRQAPLPVARSESIGDERVSAGRLRNPSRTIPQGTVIPAVLETALNSTRPGGVRALVQRDVYGFDGSRLLIPRGSRLYGEYSAELQPGQKRALVQWTRLIRPDGATIALNSPSSDPLGRAGIEGDVDNKFWQRFGGALLNSVLDVGVGLAVKQATDGVIVALPGSTQNVQAVQQPSIQPTLEVDHGTSVSVFVARDLDFSTVES